MLALRLLLFLLLGSSFFFMISEVEAANYFVSTDTSGSVGYVYRDSESDTGNKDVRNLFQVDLNNRFYIWEDWFMTGQANLKLTQDQGRVQKSSRERRTVTGGAALNVLPQSKTPLSLSYSRSDSQLNNDVSVTSDTATPIVNDQVVTEYGSLTQSLIGDRHRVQFRYITNQQESDRRGAFGSDTFEVDGILRGKGQDLTLNYRMKQEESYDQVDRQSQSMNVRHSYNVSEQIDWNTRLSMTSSQQQIGSQIDQDTIDYSMGMQQFSSNLMWRSDDRKTSVTSGVRYSAVEMGEGSRATTNANASGSVAIMHRFTPNLTANASSSHSRVLQKSSDDSGLTQHKLGVSYRSDQIDLASYRYSWQASTGITQRKDQNQTQNEVTLSVGHSILRDWRLNKFNRINLRASQDLFANSTDNADTDYPNRQQLGHRIMLGWSRNQPATSQNVQLSLSDRRDLAKNNVMQMFSAEYSQDAQMTQSISVNANLKYQLNRYHYAENDSTSSLTALKSASFYLNFVNPFSISGLVFNSELTYSESESDYNDDQTKEVLWKTKFLYRVGKLNASLQHTLRDVRGVNYSLLYFNVKRVF
ncbi:MAG: hypothetical protein RI556_10855 [Hydrogenovibrio sp.]|uniref:hypothetical protein n=1 Tax=Hydrogenovibrio sp. TaxID=2065821 RepID=UPI002870706D|nr:hypothetical protein [Hydrogenovibrio sp.]MDR9499664.1 hypothetical protein [Hydrogenovibrio sp.]